MSINVSFSDLDSLPKNYDFSLSDWSSANKSINSINTDS